MKEQCLAYIKLATTNTQNYKAELISSSVLSNHLRYNKENRIVLLNGKLSPDMGRPWSDITSVGGDEWLFELLLEFPFNFPTKEEYGQYSIKYDDHKTYSELDYSCLIDSYDVYNKQFNYQYSIIAHSAMVQLAINDINMIPVKTKLNSVFVSSFKLKGKTAEQALVNGLRKMEKRIFNSLNLLLDMWRTNDDLTFLIPPTISSIHVSNAWIACVDTHNNTLAGYKFVLSTRSDSNIPSSLKSSVYESISNLQLDKIERFFSLAISYKHEGSNDISLLHCAFALEVATNELMDVYLKGLFSNTDIKNSNFTFSHNLTYAYVALHEKGMIEKLLWHKINEIRRARNDIAHGNPSEITDAKLDEYLDSAQQYINLVKQYLAEEAT